MKRREILFCQKIKLTNFGLVLNLIKAHHQKSVLNKLCFPLLCGGPLSGEIPFSISL